MKVKELKKDSTLIEFDDRDINKENLTDPIIDILLNLIIKNTY